MRLLVVSRVQEAIATALHEIHGQLDAERVNHMRRTIAQFSAMISASRLTLETALRLQAVEVERLLAAPPPRAARVFFERDFSQGRAPVPGLYPSLRHMYLAAGNMSYMEVTYAAPVFSLAPGADQSATAPDAARLSKLAVFRDLMSPWHQDMVLWQTVTLNNGLKAVYPGHGGRTGAPAAEPPASMRLKSPDSKVTWVGPQIDPATLHVAWSATLPIRRPDGSPAGVTGMVVPLRPLLERPWSNGNLPAHTRFFVCLLPDQTGRPGLGPLQILAEDVGQDEERRTWRTPLTPTFIRSDNENTYQAMIADLTLGQSGVQRMPYRGRDSLWSFGPITQGAGRESYLVLITPYAEVQRSAERVVDVLDDLLATLLNMTRYFAFGVAVGVTVLALFFSKTVTRPIERLQRGARRLAQGDFDTRIDIRSRDELGDLARMFNQVGPRLKEHYMLTQALDVAVEVQQNLLPKGGLQRDGIEIMGRSLYCDETGGDYFDYFETAGSGAGRILVLVGDVSGHGLQSALLMTTARAHLRQRSALPGDLSRIVTDVNRQLVRDVEETGGFMTLFCLSVDTAAGTVRWVRAGHEPGLLYDAQDDQFETLEGPGVSLGVMAAFDFEEQSRPIRPGEIILLGTDGIWEARDRSGEMFGRKRIRQILREEAGRSAREIVEAIIQAVQVFREGAAQMDDVTLVVVKITGEAGPRDSG